MRIRNIITLAAFAAASQWLHAAPALATSFQEDRRSTDLVAKLLGDADSARLRLMSNDTATANKDITSALAVRSVLVKLAHANGMSMVVPIYTELDDNVPLSNGWIVQNEAAGTSVAAREKSLEVTYFAIDLDKAGARLDAAELAVRGKNDRSAEESLAAIRSDLIHSYNAGDVPLLTARRDLARAMGDINAKQFAAASIALQNASASLNSYSSVGHTAAAHQLAADIHAAIPLNAQSGAPLSTKIDDWWGSIKTWFSQHM
jgi:hypothetical protein